MLQAEEECGKELHSSILLLYKWDLRSCLPLSGSPCPRCTGCAARSAPAALAGSSSPHPPPHRPCSSAATRKGRHPQQRVTTCMQSFVWQASWGMRTRRPLQCGCSTMQFRQVCQRCCESRSSPRQTPQGACGSPAASTSKPHCMAFVTNGNAAALAQAASKQRTCLAFSMDSMGG